MSELPEDILQQVNSHLGGHARALGLSFVQVTPDELTAELEVGEQHLQPYGLVHGGVHTSMIETVCSVGAAVGAVARNLSAVGLENTTSFLRAVRSGVLRCTARPLHRGGRSEVWEGRIHDDQGRLVASGRVRLLLLEQGVRADGEAVALKQ